MGPVLEQLSVVDGVGDQRARVRAEPGEQRQFLAANEHVDRVDLDQPDRVEHAAKVAAVTAGRARPGEALRGERDPAGGIGGERDGGWRGHDPRAYNCSITPSGTG